MAHHVFHRGSIGGVLTLPAFAGLTKIRFTVNDMGTTYATSDPVGSWRSIGDVEINTTAAGAARPTMQADGSVLFDSVDDILKSATGLAIDMSAGVTVFITMNRTGALPNPSFSGPFSMTESPNAHAADVLLTQMQNNTSGETTMKWDANNGGAGANSQWIHTDDENNTTAFHIRSAQFEAGLDPGDNPLYFNGAVANGVTEFAAIAAIATAIDQLEIGNGYTAEFDGALKDLTFYYGGTMTTTQVAEVHTALNAIYTVY